MSDVVVLRASLPAPVLAERFLDAIGKGAGVDLVVEGKRAALVPEVSRRLKLGGRDAVAAVTVGMLLPKVVGLLIQAHRLGRTWECRKVAGTRDVILEIRLDPNAVHRER